MKNTISALVANRPGVLAEMAASFGALQVNIKSIACGETENPEVSRMVIQVEAGDDELGRILESMQAMEAVIQVDDLARREFVDRELILVKVALDHEASSRLMQVLEVFRATVVGMGETTMTVEMAGDQERVEGLIKLLKPFGIKSLCRTGAIALKRGDE